MQDTIYKEMRIALIEALGGKCIKCNSTTNLILHYKDRNSKNNILGNFEVLCKSCHGKEHKDQFSSGIARIRAIKSEGKKRVWSI